MTTLCRHPEPQEANASTIRKRSPRRLSATEHQVVLGVRHGRRFADEPPGQVFAKFLD